METVAQLPVTAPPANSGSLVERPSNTEARSTQLKPARPALPPPAEHSPTRKVTLEPLTAEQQMMIQGDDMEPRGTGRYVRHFPESGGYVCARCGNLVAHASSKVRDGAFATFCKYTARNLVTAMPKSGEARILARCSHCNALMGELTEEGDTDVFKVNSCSVVYTNCGIPPWADTTFRELADVEDVEDEEATDDKEIGVLSDDAERALMAKRFGKLACKNDPTTALAAATPPLRSFQNEADDDVRE